MSYKHSLDEYNIQAATQVSPLIIEVFHPQSVVDFGCGIGTWLHVMKSMGVEEVIGVDGDYVDKTLLYSFINEPEFIPHDLTQPIHLGRKFDLVISLEVAEHLPESSADEFIQTLVSHGDVILFSAAIPNQTGDGHINEQWSDYWEDKFNSSGFIVFNSLREIFWNNEQVNWWYSQNLLLAIKEEEFNNIFHQTPRELQHIFNKIQISKLVHPLLHAMKEDQITYLEKRISQIYEGSIPIRDIFYILAKKIYTTLTKKMLELKKCQSVIYKFSNIFSIFNMP